MGKLVNRTKMSVSGTPGTGTITLGSAVSGFQTFAAAGVNDQDLVSYVVEDGAAWEVGEGLYSASGTTLARALIASSTGSLLNLSSGAMVYGSPLATDLVRSSVRQTAQSGPINASGLPTFTPPSSASLTLTTQNITPATPLVVSAANSGNAQGIRDRVGTATANLSFTGTPSATNFGYVIVNADGSLTPGTTTLPAIYQLGGTPSTTNGQFTFNTGEMRGYLGNGSTAPQVYLVFILEFVASASTITSTIAYAYNGFFDSGFTTGLPGASVLTTVTTNLGVPPGALVVAEVVFQNVTPEAGYSAGDVLTRPTAYQASGTLCTEVAPIIRRNTVLFLAAPSGWIALSLSTGQIFTQTSSNWAWKLVARRCF